MAQALPFVAVALGAMGAAAQVQAGKTTAAGYMAQATQSRTQAKSEELKYKQQGVAVLDNILRTQAALTARAGAGGIDPFSGSAGALQQYALAQGAKENYMARDNAIIVLRSGELQAQQYESAARAAISQARGAAFMTLATTAVSAGMLGGFGGEAPSGAVGAPTSLTTPLNAPAATGLAGLQPVTFGGTLPNLTPMAGSGFPGLGLGGLY
jgi:hypothetical protein